MNNYQKVGIGFFIFAVFGFIVTVKESFIVALIGGIIFCLPGFYFFRKTDKKLENKKEIKKAKQIEKNKIYKAEQEKKEYEQTHIKGIHEAGLPLANGIECLIGYEEGKFNFKGSGNSFDLSFEKITDICIKTDTEIQKQYISSIGGAIAGGVVFGALGAIVGGRAKEKKSTTVREYLIFTYLKENEVNYISFDVTDNWFKAQKLIDMFNENNKIVQLETIEL